MGFRILTAPDVSWRQLGGGAIGAAILYGLLPALGGYYVGHVVHNAGDTYGTFALVICLLSWIYLAAHIALLAAEANVVATRRLSPRSFSIVIEQPPTGADKRALRQRGMIEERRHDETVTVNFLDREETDAPLPPAPAVPIPSRPLVRERRPAGPPPGARREVGRELAAGSRASRRILPSAAGSAGSARPRTRAATL